MSNYRVARCYEELQDELDDAERMYKAISTDIRRRIDQPCEKLHYWDGKVTGLKLAIGIMRQKLGDM